MIRQKRFINGKIIITEQGTHRSSKGGDMRPSNMNLTEDNRGDDRSLSPTP